MRSDCPAECGHREPLTGRCAWMERHGPCNFGAMAMAMDDERLADFGEWKVRQYADGPICARLRSRAGAVEVWGGAHTAHEVLFVPKGRGAQPVYVTADWFIEDAICQPSDGMRLRDAVGRACAMAGVQTRMEVGA